MKKYFSCLLIVIASACSLSGGGGSLYVVKPKVPQFCQKRCSGGEKLENINADMHCATEALLDSNGNVLLEPLVQGAINDNRLDNLARLQKMIDYFSAIATSNENKMSKVILIPNGTYFFRLTSILKMKSHVTITGSDKGTYLKNPTVKTGITFGEENNPSIIKSSSLMNLHFENFYIDITQNAKNITIDSSSFLLNTVSETDAYHTYIISIFGDTIDITNNFFNISPNHPGAAILQGIPTASYGSVDENASMGYNCTNSPDYGNTQENTTCRYKYLGIMPNTLEMPLIAEPGKTNKKVVEIREFPDKDHKGDGTEVSCHVDWLSTDTGIMQTEVNSSPGTKTTLIPVKAGVANLSAKLKDTTVSISGPSSQNVTIIGNYFANVRRADQHKLWHDKVKETVKRFAWDHKHHGDPNENFDTIWYAKDHFNTNFSNNFLYSSKSSPTSSMIHSFNHCNLSIMKNYFGEWKNNTREVTLGNGKNINFHQNYLKNRTVSAYKSTSANPPTVSDFYAFYNYFDGDDADITGFPPDFIKNNWFYSTQKENQLSNLHCTDNTCTGSIKTPNDTKNGLNLLSKNQKILLNNNATKEYPKKDGSINGPIKEPRVTNVICDPKYRRPKITQYQVIKRYIPLTTKSEEKPCPTYEKEMKENPDELCPSEKYNYCRKHFSDLSNEGELELGKVKDLTVTVSDSNVGGSEVKENPALTYGCEHPIGKNKNESYLYLGANLHYGHKIEASIVHIAGLNDFRDTTKADDGTYNFFGTVYSGDMSQSHNHGKYQSTPYFNSSYGDINGFKCFGLTSSDFPEDYFTYWLVRFLKSSCFDQTSKETYHGRYIDGEDVAGSFAYKLEFDDFIVLQTNHVHWYSWKEDKHVAWTFYDYDWHFYEDRNLLKKWVNDAKNDGKEIIVLSVLPPSRFDSSFKTYLDSRNVLAYLYADFSDNTNQTATGCNNTDTCVIKIGATYEGTGIMLGVDKKNQKIQVYSIVDSKFQHISRWFELDFKNH